MCVRVLSIKMYIQYPHNIVVSSYLKGHDRCVTKRVRSLLKAPHVIHKLSTFFSTKDISREMRLYCGFIVAL